MATIITSMASGPTRRNLAQRAFDFASELPIGVIQTLIALTTTLPALRATRFFFTTRFGADDRDSNRNWFLRFGVSILIFGVASTITVIQLAATMISLTVAGIAIYLLINPSARAGFDVMKFFQSMEPSEIFVRSIINGAFMVFTVLLDRPFLGSFENVDSDMPTLRFVLQRRIGLTKALIRVGATMILMGLSLLPLSVLLLALPATNPSEAVLSDTIPPARTWIRGMARRIIGLITAFVMLLALVAFATEILALLRLPGDTFYGQGLRGMLPTNLVQRLPYTLIEHWPHVLLLIYLLDLIILAVIGKVPHSYMLRNMIVRWRVTGLTALAFIVVIFMLTFMLAFVNGMTKLTESSGVPGNVIVMSDGATDELFSNLGYGDVGSIDRVVCDLDENNNRLRKPITVKTKKMGNDTAFLASKETYCVVNQIIPNSDNRRRFIQLRIIADSHISAAVHNIDLMDKSHEWFSDKGVDPTGEHVSCVIGQGVAQTMGEDVGKKSLAPGDIFELADMTWIVAGVMKTEGTTFGSEVWCSNRANKVTKALGKANFTTYVMRVSEETDEAAKAMAYHLRNRYQVQKLKAVPEKEYFADLSKSNQQTLYAIIIVAVVMAIGGVFGVMNMMFAAIAQRTKDIGILRLLGFKRWQVLVSFLLESMAIALIGGLLGVLLGRLTDGFTVTSMASGGQGSGKTVAAKLIVDRDVMMIGLLFTLVMGRLGGLVPALSAMRLQILESLR